MARTLTREEFYELVWSKPMTQLAKEFAISDVALHKICKKHDIPNPPLGWWAKKAAGKPVRRIPLPDAKDGAARSITIASADLSREGAVLAEVREQARVLAATASDDADAPSNPIVDRTISKLRQMKRSETGVVTTEPAGVIKCSIAPSSIERLAVALPRIVHAASLQGFKLMTSGGPAAFELEGVSVGFSISETIRREKHVVTDDERAKMEAWERKRDRASRLNHWNIYSSMPRFADWDFHPTGQLAFEFEHSYFCRGIAPRRSFRYGKHQRLEEMANDIAVGLAVLAAAKKEDRIQREAEQRRREEEQRRREQIARLKHIEDRRAAGLGALLKELDELDQLRRLMSMLTRDVAQSPSPRVTALLTWAKDHLAKREARLSGPEIEKRLAAEHLLGHDDDHAFRSPSWY